MISTRQGSIKSALEGRKKSSLLRCRTQVEHTRTYPGVVPDGFLENFHQHIGTAVHDQVLFLKIVCGLDDPEYLVVRMYRATQHEII